MTASFKMYHKSGLLVDFCVSESYDPYEFVEKVTRAIDIALTGAWSVCEPEKILNGNKTYGITGWVFGRSAKKDIPVVWLYSNISPEYKVTQVYGEKIDELPLGVDLKSGSHKPFPGGIAPKKDAAKRDGWYNECEQFEILCEDTGEVFEGHSVYKFVRVISATPSPAVQEKRNDQPKVVSEENPFHDNTLGATSSADKLTAKISVMFGKNAAAATSWLIRSYTTKRTPENVRQDVGSLTDAECATLLAGLTNNESDTKESFAKYLQRQSTQAAGK